MSEKKAEKKLSPVESEFARIQTLPIESERQKALSAFYAANPDFVASKDCAAAAE